MMFEAFEVLQMWDPPFFVNNPPKMVPTMGTPKFPSFLGVITYKSIYLGVLNLHFFMGCWGPRVVI